MDWPIHQADLLSLDQTMLMAAGIPMPGGGPLLFYAGSVAARISGVQPV